MPKRLLDGDRLWRSDKLKRVQPESFRAEYANMLPLALADGTFECNPDRVWYEVYAYNRPSVSTENVQAILDEFERVKLLFRWQDSDGKTWGFWTGIEKSLPTSAQIQQSHYKIGKSVPRTRLEEFLQDRYKPDSGPEKIVYFIQESPSALIKIGVSTSPEQRRYYFEARRKNPMVILATEKGGFQKETELHHRFKRFHVGREWFKPDQSLLTYIDEINNVSTTCPQQETRTWIGLDRNGLEGNGLDPKPAPLSTFEDLADKWSEDVNQKENS